MPNILNENGLTTETQSEMTQKLNGALEAAYGTDISLGPDTPDGQLNGVFILSGQDVLDLIREVFNSMDPDQARGRVQDMRYALNNLQRKGGTHTLQPIRITVSQATTLFGADQDVEDIYVVSDDAGTEFELMTTINLPNPGSYDLIFQSVEVGKVEVIPNTITNPVTVNIAVTAINNPTGPISVGINEETDPEFRLRRQQSTAISATGFPQALEALLRNVNGVTSARVYENTTSADPDANGVPSHSIWAIVSGTYNPEEVAQAIYVKRGAGCGMRGDEQYTIATPDGGTFTAKWDNVASQVLYVKIVVEPIDTSKPVDIASIRSRLPEMFSIGIGEAANINSISTLVRDVDSNAVVTSGGLSLIAAGPFTSKVSPSQKNMQLVLESANIIITPIQIIPSNASVVGGAVPESRGFVALGGFGAYTWEVEVKNSGPSADIDTDGVYTPGTVNQSVYDTIKVTDSQGNTASVQVEVT
ncbi:putative baseplate protein [Bdellovibrio phage phi1422]|uniref:baseplate wedge subunit n=1 Tax=Bdellovibrio phage phi1422 TaxID=1127515 RepID=UPI0002536D75|nr:baseplate wedge subunit [Bdellovibrio phage phi1422]AFC22585.1 putative baseplate protein [Bdellovibrio phage phi1422]